MKVSGFLEQVLFVIVLYRQRPRNSKALESLEPLMKKYPDKVSVFVYDNSEAAVSDLRGIRYYFHDAKNPGVSRAYNCAFAYAKQNKFRFLLLMDQDSFFPESIFDSYSHAVAQHPDVEVFAPRVNDQQNFYSPFRLAGGRGTPLPKLKSGVHALIETKLINSGLLIGVTTFEKCEGYDERFPLDFSDIVFCDRLCANNFSVCLLEGSIFHEHSSSNISTSEESKTRFEHYLKALALYKTITKTNVSYWWSGLPRAAKLSVQLRDQWFLRRLFDLRA
jgi:GT2 family glycosyltransferase